MWRHIIGTMTGKDKDVSEAVAKMCEFFNAINTNIGDNYFGKK